VAFNPLNWLLGLFSLDIGIDLGTANTLVHVRGKGIVLNEPSWVAIEKRSKRPLFIGAEAKEMVGRTPANVIALRPLRDGVISEFDITEAMLEYFIGKAHEQSIAPVPRPRVVVGIPSGATEVERRAVFDATMAAGARETYLIEEPTAAALGAGLPIGEIGGSMIVDIGAKSTDLGIVRAGQMVFARTIPTAGEAFTRAIEAALGLASGQAEEYKRTYGFDTQKMQGKITEAMKPVMNVITAEVRKTGDFYMSKHRGEQVKLVTLSGGVALVPEVVNVLSGLLGMEVAVGNPFNRIEMDKNKTSQLLGLGPFYAVAAGLAMRTS